MAKEKGWNLDRVKKEVRRLDPNLKEDENYFKTAVMMIAALFVGQNINNLARFTGIPKDYLRSRAAALRSNGIWRNGKVAAEWFSESGALAFWMDVAVAEGLLARSR